MRMVDWKALEREARAAVGITSMDQLREALRSAAAAPAAFNVDLRELARAATGLTPEDLAAFEALQPPFLSRAARRALEHAAPAAARALRVREVLAVW